MNTLGAYLGVRLLPRVARRSWFMHGFINRLALGDTAELEKVLDLGEQSIRGAQARPQ